MAGLRVLARDSWPPGTVIPCWQCPTQPSLGRAKSKRLRKPRKTGASGPVKRSSIALCGRQQPHSLQALLPGQNRRPWMPDPSNSGPLATSLGPPLPPVSTWTETFTRTRLKHPGPVSRALCRDVVGKMGCECPVPQRVSNTRKGGEETTFLIPLLSPKHLSSTPFHPKPASCPLEAPRRPPPAPGLGGGQRPQGAAGRGVSKPFQSPEGRRYPPLPGTQPQTSLLAALRANGNSAPAIRHAPSSPSLRPPGSSLGVGWGASSKTGQQKGGEARMRSGIPRPAFRAPRRRAKKMHWRTQLFGGRPRVYPRRARFQPRLPAHAPSRRGAQDLPSGIPAR